MLMYFFGICLLTDRNNIFIIRNVIFYKEKQGEYPFYNFPCVRFPEWGLLWLADFTISGVGGRHVALCLWKWLPSPLSAYEIGWQLPRFLLDLSSQINTTAASRKRKHVQKPYYKKCAGGERGVRGGPTVLDMNTSDIVTGLVAFWKFGQLLKH